MSLQEAARHPEWLRFRPESDTEAGASDTPTPAPVVEAKTTAPTEEPMTDAEKAQLARESGNTAVANYRTATQTAREAVSGLALPDAIKNRIVEAQTNTIPLLEGGAVDVATITQRTKDAAATEAQIAQEAYGWGSGQVQNGASEPIEVEKGRTTEAQKKRDLAPLQAQLQRL